MTKKKVALITTTINVPHSLKRYVEHVPDDVELDVIVAGDVQTDVHAEQFVTEFGGVYLSVDDPRVTRWSSNTAIGTRSIQRRNLALLHALTEGAEFIITVDDDNVPVQPETYLQDMTTCVEWYGGRVRTQSGWWNPGSLYYDELTIRGFPLEQRHVPHIESYRHELKSRVGVSQGLTVGDPDVDAIERIVRRPIVEQQQANFGHVVLDAGTWAPFNSQNTGYVRELAPLMQVLSGVGRYDDIWGSYIARKVMDHFGWYVRYGDPATFSERNEHDLVTDLERELFGYRHTSQFVNLLQKIDLSHAKSILDALGIVYDELWSRLAVPAKTIDVNFAWLKDVKQALTEGDTK